MNRDFLPFALHDIGDGEIAACVEALRSDWITTGPRTQRFEKEFADFVGARFAVAVNSATAGLHLALEAVGVGPGDLVVTTPYTFTATAEVVRYLGADVVFADIDPTTMNIDPERVAEVLHGLEAKGRRAKVLLPVHYGGLAADMEALSALAERYGLSVVEDAAHALPCTNKGRMVGTIGRATVFSFYATKTITTGEGGMVTTGDEALARRMRVMRLHGIDRDVWNRYVADRPSWYYEVVAPGFKYNMTDIAAAIGLVQLSRCREMWARRAAIASRYLEAFAGDDRLELPAVPPPGETHAWHLFPVRLRGVDRDRFIAQMTARKVGTSVHFIPLHVHPYWRDRYGLAPDAFPVAWNAFQRSVSLPIYSRMDDDAVERVISAVKASLCAAKV